MTSPDPARIRILSDCIRLLILALGSESPTFRAAAAECAKTILGEAGEPEKQSDNVVELHPKIKHEGSP